MNLEAANDHASASSDVRVTVSMNLESGIPVAPASAPASVTAPASVPAPAPAPTSAPARLKCFTKGCNCDTVSC